MSDNVMLKCWHSMPLCISLISVIKQNHTSPKGKEKKRDDWMPWTYPFFKTGELASAKTETNHL